MLSGEVERVELCGDEDPVLPLPETEISFLEFTPTCWLERRTKRTIIFSAHMTILMGGDVSQDEVALKATL